MRRLASESIVLLKNEGAVLPIRAKGVKKIAIVGGNAKAIVLSGGGSAALKPSYFTTPYDGIINALPEGIEVTYTEGAPGKLQETEINLISKLLLSFQLTKRSLLWITR